MYFRTSLSFPADLSAPFTTTLTNPCDLAEFVMTCKVDNELVISNTNLGTLVGQPSTLPTTSGHYLTILTGTMGLSPIIVKVNKGILESSEIYLKVEHIANAFLPYERTFKVFGYDLGNDLSIVSGTTGTPINYNVDMGIVLIPKSLVINNLGQEIYGFAKTAFYREPLTNKVYYLNLSSSSGEHNVISNISLLNTQNGYYPNCGTHIVDYQIKSFYYDINGQKIYTETKTGFETLAVAKQLINLSASIPNECTTCTECYILPSTDIELEYSNLKDLYYFKNDIIEPLVSEIHLDFQVIDGLDSVAHQDTRILQLLPFISLAFFNLSSGTGLTHYAMPTISKGKAYTFRFKALCVEVFNCVRDYKVIPCEATYLEQTSCSSFTYRINTGDPHTIILRKYNSDEILKTVVVAVGDVAVFDQLEDGVYLLYDQKTDITYSLVSYCAIKACYEKLLQTLLCKDNDDCGCHDCEDCGCIDKHEKIITFKLMFDIFMYNLNNIYQAGYATSLLDDSSNPFLTDIDAAIKVMLKICKPCNCH